MRGDDALAGPRGPRGVEQRGRVVLRDALAAARGVGRRGGDLPDGGDDGAVVRGEPRGVVGGVGSGACIAGGVGGGGCHGDVKRSRWHWQRSRGDGRPG